MANNKRITLDWDASGLTVYCIIRRESDNYRLNDADGAFAAAPADPYISLTEDAVIKGRYELNESRTLWSDGRYTIAVYNQAGGSPAPASDTIIGTGELVIKDDLETLLDYSISSILAQVAGTGNRVVTIHVQDALAAPIADVLVRIGTATQLTNVSGDAVFALDDGSYDVVLRKQFVLFTVPESLTVAGDGTHNFTGALFAPAAPTQPNTCVVYGNVIDITGTEVSGAKIDIQETDKTTFSNAQKIVKNNRAVSDVDGYWQLEVIRSSELDPNTSAYKAVITYSGFRYETTITVPDQDSVEFSTIVGT